MSNNLTRLNILEYMKYHYSNESDIPVELDEIAGDLGIDKDDASANLRYMVEKGWLNPCIGYNGDTAYEMNAKGMEVLDDLLSHVDKNGKSGIPPMVNQKYNTILKKGNEFLGEIREIKKFESSDLRKMLGEDLPPKIENLMEIEAEFCGFLRGAFEDGPDRLSRHTKLKEDFLKYRKNNVGLRFDVVKVQQEHFYEYANWLERRIKEVTAEAETQIDLKETFEKPEPTNPYLSISVIDPFYTKLILDINKSYHCEMYTVTLILIRKLFENMVIDILRKKYKTDTTSYLNSNSKYHMFHIIMSNAKKKIIEGDFNNVKKDLEEALEWISKLRDEGNRSTHSITFDIQKPELDKIKTDVERYAHLLTRIFSMV